MKSIIIMKKPVWFSLKRKFLHVLSTSIQQIFASELASSSVQDVIEKKNTSNVNFVASETKNNKLNQMIQHLSGKSMLRGFFDSVFFSRDSLSRLGYIQLSDIGSSQYCLVSIWPRHLRNGINGARRAVIVKCKNWIILSQDSGCCKHPRMFASLALLSLMLINSANCEVEMEEEEFALVRL